MIDEITDNIGAVVVLIIGIMMIYPILALVDGEFASITMLFESTLMIIIGLIFAVPVGYGMLSLLVTQQGR